MPPRKIASYLLSVQLALVAKLMFAELTPWRLHIQFCERYRIIRNSVYGLGEGRSNYCDFTEQLSVSVMMRLIYVSEADLLPGSMLAEARQIYLSSKRNNAVSGLTGALLFSDSNFLQALEGERTIVSATFTRILTDERHGNVCIISAEECETRVFGEWHMQLVGRSDRTRHVFEEWNFARTFRPTELNARQALEFLLALCRESGNDC